MRRDALQKAVSPPVRLKIAGMVSARPRSLEELSAATGVTVQAVLKHLKVLKEVGVIEESEVRGSEFTVRKVYSEGRVTLRDFSTEEMMLVKLGRGAEVSAAPSPVDLEVLAQDAIVRRRQVREHARRLARMIDDLVADEARVRGSIESLPTGEGDKLALRVLFAEESVEQAVSVLQREFGFRGGREGIGRLLSRVDRSTIEASVEGESGRRRGRPRQGPESRRLRDK